MKNTHIALWKTSLAMNSMPMDSLFPQGESASCLMAVLTARNVNDGWKNIRTSALRMASVLNHSWSQNDNLLKQALRVSVDNIIVRAIERTRYVG